MPRPSCVVVALLLLGCVSTDLEPVPGMPCVAQVASEPPRESVVLISQADGLSSDLCPGIVVAPTLVATAASCLFPRVGQRLSPAEAPSCDNEAGWGPVENGDFSNWIGRASEVDDIDIYAAIGRDTPPLPVQKIYRSGAMSRCADDLALAFVPTGLTAAAAPVRLDESTQVGEAVTLAGLDALNGYYQPNEASATVGQMTDGAGDTATPPRSLLLDGQVCFFARGGGVFAATTGALLGIIAWGPSDCEEPGGSTVAVRLAPFRRFLLEVAAETQGQPLRAEDTPRNARDLEPCPD